MSTEKSLSATGVITPSDVANLKSDGPETIQSGTDEKPVESAVGDVQVFKPDFRFWAVLFALCFTSLLGSLESTVIATALPAILTDLDVGSNYVWIGNIFFLTSAAVQPLFGQLSNLFGRRYVTLAIVALFTLGSGVAGGATSPAMLIAGRGVQGMGSGGINMIIDVIISDLVPLRQRGNYIAVVLLVYGVGTAVGPFLGGIIVEHTTWRWVFYINLPIGGVSMILLYLFLRVKWNRQSTIRERLRRIDYIGNAILIAATVSTLIALTWANTVHPWSSAQVIVPLVVGLAGLGAFLWFEGSGLVPEPVMPLRLFANRTAAILYATTFLNAVTVYWITFFLPLYFMSVLLSSPSWTGVQALPLALVAIPGAALSAVALSRWGRYKPLHIAGFALNTLGFGLFSLLDKNSSTAAWVCFELVFAFGLGMLLNTILPAFQNGVAEADQAAATASWAFVRSLGAVWGVAIPAAVFNSYAARYSVAVSDPAVRSIFQSGNAYASASSRFITSFAEPLRGEIVEVYTQALRKTYVIGVAFGGFAFLLSLLEREATLRTELETEFGLEERKKEGSGDSSGGV